jgi:eukaryotic-like serine/threonine-protein kinase
LTKARELSRLALTSAAREQEKEREANFESSAAMWEALSGNASESREHATTALALSNSRDAESMAALSLAFAGDSSRTEALAADLGKRLPEDTIVQLNYLPAVQAQVALNRKDSANALHALQSALPYELGVADSGFAPNLLAVCVRGQAYLTTHRGREAATEFQKILDHRGIVVNEPNGALAHLGLARAYVLQGDTAKARTAYRDFLTLWKDADPDIPILKRAKAEYAKLQ